MNLLENVKRFIRDERGLETVEYAIMAALVAVAAIAVLRSIGVEITAVFQGLLDALAPAAG